MKRTMTMAALLTALCILTACGPDMGWSKKGTHHSTWDVDETNCAWELTHKKKGDGTYAKVERSDVEMENGIRACMEAKGYTWGNMED